MEESGTMNTHAMIVNVEVAVVRDGLYLATTRGTGESYGSGWVGFPGGKVDRGFPVANILEETARREVLEETGLVLDDPVVYVESHTFGIGEETVLDVVMLARSFTGTAFAASSQEVSAVEWLTFDNLMAHPGVQQWTRDSLALVERERERLGW
jgi:8-oxo-dGTP pyrophosphatase MutT (NUDIX family)